MQSINNPSLFLFQMPDSTNNNQTTLPTTTQQQTVIPKKSHVWSYFERIVSNQQLKAKCLVDNCTTVLSTPLYSTSTLIRHLQYVHQITEFKSKETLVNHSTTRKISLQLKKKLDDAVVTAIVEDGRGFGDFSKSGIKKFIQLAFSSEKILIFVFYL